MYFFTFCFRGTPGEESGGHLIVGVEAFPAKTPNQPGESAPLAWCQHAGSTATEGLCLSLIRHTSYITRVSGRRQELWALCIGGDC